MTPGRRRLAAGAAAATVAAAVAAAARHPRVQRAVFRMRPSLARLVLRAVLPGGTVVVNAAITGAVHTRGGRPALVVGNDITVLGEGTAFRVGGGAPALIEDNRVTIVAGGCGAGRRPANGIGGAVQHRPA